MNKKWAEDYSSEEGSGDDYSDEEMHFSDAKTSKDVVTVADPQHLIVEVSEISYSASRSDIGKFFEEEGCKILRLDLLESNGRSRGIAVIEFSNTSSLDICMKLNNKNIFGRNIKVVPFNTNLNMTPLLKKSELDRFRDIKRNEKSGYLKFKQVDVQKKNHSETRISSRPASGSILAKHGDSVPERPKLNLKPRTLPIESESAVGSKQTIFGVGKAHDDNAYEVQQIFFIALLFNFIPLQELKKKTQISDKDDTNACIVDSVLFNPSEVLMQDKSIMKADGKQCGSSVQHATGKLKPRDSKPNVRNKYVKPVVNSVVNGEDNSHDKLLDGKSSVKFSKANKSLLKGNAFILKPVRFHYHCYFGFQ